jgi:hypothetical protein
MTNSCEFQDESDSYSFGFLLCSDGIQVSSCERTMYQFSLDALSWRQDTVLTDLIVGCRSISLLSRMKTMEGKLQ